MRGCRPLSDSEISRLLDLLSSPAWRRERAFIVLGLRTGLRLTSMLSLRIGDMAIAGEVQNRIRIRRGTTKGRRAGYDMPLHPRRRPRPSRNTSIPCSTSPREPTSSRDDGLTHASPRQQAGERSSGLLPLRESRERRPRSAFILCERPSPRGSTRLSAMISSAPVTPCATPAFRRPSNTSPSERRKWSGNFKTLDESRFRERDRRKEPFQQKLDRPLQSSIQAVFLVKSPLI